jgi:hypothetical protein
MTFTVFACETVSGTNLGPLECSLGTWSRTMNGSDAVSVQLNRGTLTPSTRAYWRGMTEPDRMTLVVDWDGVALAAGPIWNRPPNAGGVTVNAGGIRDLLTMRKVASRSSPYASQQFAFAGVSLGTIAAKLVQLATDPTKPGATLPIVYPATESDTDPTHQKTYNGWDLPNVADMLANLTGLLGGPDIDFVPEWVDSNRSAIRWRMRVGTGAAPKLTSTNQLAWDYSTPESGVKDFTVGDDVSQRTDVAWSRGSGSETFTLIARAASTKWTDRGYPLHERETDYTTVEQQATLDAHAAGDLAAQLDPTVQYAMTVDALTDPQLGSYQLGDVASVRVADHWWLEDSPTAGYGLRILGISGNASTDVKLTVQSADARGLDIIGSPSQELPARIKRIERLLDAGDAG